MNGANPINRYLFLPDENTDAFFEILHEAFILCQPATQSDAARVVESVKAYWFLQRAIRLVKEHESSLRRQKPNPKTWSPTERRFLTLLRRYRAAAKCSLRHTFRKLVHIRQNQRSWPQLWFSYRCLFEREIVKRQAA